MVRNLPCNAGDANSIPGPGTKIPHAAEQLSPHVSTTELVHPQQRVCVPQRKIPHDATKIPCAATKTQRRQINFKNNFAK